MVHPVFGGEKVSAVSYMLLDYYQVFKFLKTSPVADKSPVHIFPWYTRWWIEVSYYKKRVLSFSSMEELFKRSFLRTA
jgi:hypothetical protein